MVKFVKNYLGHFGYREKYRGVVTSNRPIDPMGIDTSQLPDRSNGNAQPAVSFCTKTEFLRKVHIQDVTANCGLGLPSDLSGSCEVCNSPVILPVKVDWTAVVNSDLPTKPT